MPRYPTDDCYPLPTAAGEIINVRSGPICVIRFVSPRRSLFRPLCVCPSSFVDVLLLTSTLAKKEGPAGGTGTLLHSSHDSVWAKRTTLLPILTGVILLMPTGWE